MATQHSTPDRHVGLQHIAFNPAQLQDFAEPDSPPACSVTSGPCDAYEYAAEQMEPLPAATLTAAPVVSALMRDEVAVYRQGMQENEIAVLELRREVLGLRAELALSERLRIALYCAGKGKLLMAKTALSGVERDLNRLRRMRAEDHKALVAARKQARDATEARQCLENERLLHEEQRRNHEEQCAALQQRLSEQQTTRAAEREAHAHQLAVEKGAVGREVQMLRQDMEARLRDERMLADERLAVARRHHEQQCSHFQEQLHHAQGKLIEQQQAFQDQLSEMHAKHKNEIESWQDQVDAAHARFAAQARAMQDLDSDAKARQHELESDMAHLQRELAADLASMQRDNEALLEELDRARTQHAQEAEIWKAAFQAQCAKLDGEHAEESGALIEKLSAQETEVEELRGVVKALNSEIHALQRQAGERAVQAGNLTQQLNRLSLHHDAVGMRFASAHCWQHFTQPQMTAVFRVWAARAAASRRLAQFCRLRQWRVLRRWARWSRGRRAGHELLQRRNTALSERVFVSWHHVAHAWQAWRKRQQWLMGCCLRGWASLIVHHPKRNARGMTLRIDVNPVDSSQDALHVPLHRVISLPTTPKSPAHPLRSSLSNANQWTPSPNHMPGSRGLAGQLHSVLSSPSMAGELSASTGDGEPLLTARSDMSAIGRMPSSASAMGGHQLRSQPAIQPRSHEKVWEQVQASRRLDRLPTYAPSEAIDQRSPQQQQPAGGSGAGGGPRLASAPSYAPTITPSSLRSSLASTASSSSFSDLPPPDVAWHKHRGGASAPGYEACLEPPSRMDSGIDPWAAVQDRLQAPVDPCMCQQESSLAQLLAGEAADLIRKTEPGRAQESAALADRSNQSGRTHDLTQQAASTCSTSQSSLLDIFASGGPETPRRHPSVGRAQHWPAQDQHADQTDTSYHSKQSSMMDFVGASAGQFGSGCGGRGHEREPAAKRRASRSSGAKVKVKRIPVIHACPS
ncbi:hypothetical protein WJX72_006630 [[Myrmecia] bisecta]|uniref:Uncharacterized protein n=1 Tax=[Myrmecia] bisecta TaxID=41462 RepID=A0AAW1QC02_9CHLO